MFTKSILFLCTFFIFSDAFAMHFTSLEAFKLQFEKLLPTLDMQMEVTANTLANTKPTTEFEKFATEQLELLKQDSNQNNEEAEHDEIKQNGDEKVDVMEMLIELMEKEKRDRFQLFLNEFLNK